MDLFILTILIILLIETTALLLKNRAAFFNKSSGRRKVYIDTSALMDGRILSVAQTGFISDDLIIPRSVIRELQLLADSTNAEKRSRARFGMDTVNELERVEFCDVSILPDELDRTPVDERLLVLARENKGLICTVDYNLAKVAATENIDTLNVNELALIFRSGYSLGDRISIKINSAGSNPGQGVGHMEDGTMVVVDNAAKKIGQEVNVELMRFHQTPAGCMLFARLVRTPRSPRSKSTGRRRKS